MPSGAEPPDYEELLVEPAVGAASPRNSARPTHCSSSSHRRRCAGIADLVASTDGVVVVGDAMPDGVDRVVRRRDAARTRPAAPAAPRRAAARRARRRSTRRSFRVTSMPGLALLGLIVMLVGGWPTARSPAVRRDLGPKPDTVNHRVIPAPIAVQPANPPADGVDTVAIDTPFLVLNPADSASVAAWSVELVCCKYAVRRYFEAATRRQECPDGNLLAGEGAGCDLVQGDQRRVRRAERQPTRCSARCGNASSLTGRAAPSCDCRLRS